MTKKWMILLALLVLSVVILTISIVSCNKNKSEMIPTQTEVVDIVEEEPVIETVVVEEPIVEIVESHENQDINPLTGLYIDEEVAKRRPIGIMINNLKAALPQSGLAQADVIYETLVEGAICRLFAVFQDFDAAKIGPVRSARHYFLDFSFDFDALYIHYGQSPQAMAAFSNLQTPNLNGLSYLDSIMCFQDPKRVRPHSTYTSYERLMDAWKLVEFREEIAPDFVRKLQFNEEDTATEAGVVTDKLTLSFSYYQEPYFEFNKEEGLYGRFQFDEPHIDVETNEQLKFKNIIIQLTDMWVIKGDDAGRMDMSLIGTGTGYFVSNGKSIPITWKKTSHTSPTQYFLEDETPLLINKGKTWIAVFPSNRESEIKFE